MCFKHFLLVSDTCNQYMYLFDLGSLAYLVRDISILLSVCRTSILRSGLGMRAIRVEQFGGPEVLKLENNVPVPQPNQGQVRQFLMIDMRRYVSLVSLGSKN